MKFFLVISIIAFWWVPMNSPGNIGILNFPSKQTLFPSKMEVSSNDIKSNGVATKRKMDHHDFHSRKYLIKNIK